MLMILSFITPLILLSMFPHQEPRFLIPLIFPLIYLHGDSILPTNSNASGTLTTVDKHSTNTIKKTSSIDIFKIWLIINVFLVGFYGFVHQGGVFSSVKYLHDNIGRATANTEFHIVTSGMYMLPKSFLLQRDNYILSRKHTTKKHVYLYEEGSKDVHLIMQQLKKLLDIRHANNKTKNYKLYFFTMNNRKEDMENLIPYSGLLFNKTATFWPHLSSEAMPDFTRYCFFPVSMFYQDCEIVSFCDFCQIIFEMFQLTVYQISLSS